MSTADVDDFAKLDRAMRHRLFVTEVLEGEHEPMAADDIRLAGNPYKPPAHLRRPASRNPTAGYQDPRG